MKAKASQGVTINLGNYESIRFDVEVELGSFPTDIQKRKAKKIAKAAMELSSEIVGDSIAEFQKVLEFDKNSHFKINITKSRTRQ